MNSKDKDVDDIINKLRKWKLESQNPRNDGWVQKGYLDKIKKIFNKSGKLLNKK